MTEATLENKQAKIQENLNKSNGNETKMKGELEAPIENENKKKEIKRKVATTALPQITKAPKKPCLKSSSISTEESSSKTTENKDLVSKRSQKECQVKDFKNANSSSSKSKKNKSKNSQNIKPEEESTLENGELNIENRTAVEGSQEEPVTGEEIEEGNVPKAPDGGFGWVILFASFVCNLIVDGIAFSFPVFLDDIQNNFHTQKTTASLVLSMLTGMYLLVGKIFCFIYLAFH